MSNNKPLITVGLPAFNNESTIEAAIRSIVLQTYENWELILIDDGSTDATRSIMQKFNDPRITVIYDNTNRGRAARTNQAIRLGKGDYFANMDGDDFSFPKRLQYQIEYLGEHPEIDLVGTGLLVFKELGCVDGSYPIKTSHESICSKPWAGFNLAGATLMGKREWFLTNQYRSELRRVEDQDLLFRTYLTSRFACLPEILYGYRVNNLPLKKILKDRYFLSFSFLSNAMLRGDYSLGLKAIAGQVLKATIDIVAITSGLNYKLLRHRALPVEEEVLQEWDRVWKNCNMINQ